MNYLFIFLFYLIISVPEFVFWILCLTDKNQGNMWLFKMWASWPGLYGGWVLYFFTVLWPIVQMAELNNVTAFGFVNAQWQMLLFAITWLFTGIIHVLGVPFVKRQYKRDFLALEGKEAPKNAVPAEETANAAEEGEAAETEADAEEGEGDEDAEEGAAAEEGEEAEEGETAEGDW